MKEEMVSKKRIGGSINDVIHYAKVNIEGRVALSLSKMDELAGRYGYNGGQPCDVLNGPCSCGAWHHMDWKKCREKVSSFYSSLVEMLQNPQEEESFTQWSRISLIIHQNQPFIELLVHPRLMEKGLDGALKETVQKHAACNKFVLYEGISVDGKWEEHENAYTLEPDYRNAKRKFGFIV